MHYIFGIFMFATLLVFMAVFASMAIAGVYRGRIYYEPSCPPIAFRSRPMAFLALYLFYVALVVFCALGAVRAGAALLATS